MIELDFLPVGDSNGDAICMQYSGDSGVYVHVVDGAYAETGEKIVEHIREHYGRSYHVSHMVLSHADNDHACGLVEVMKRISVKHLWMNRPWLFADQTLPHFHGLFTRQGLIDRMRELHPYLVELGRQQRRVPARPGEQRVSAARLSRLRDAWHQAHAPLRQRARLAQCEAVAILR
jgi:glyoxylase-like metal-dependent hydrolase (beta-lactamase superfamily II)